VVGPIFSNILQAIHKPVDGHQDVPDQPERRPVQLRRQELQPVFYVTSYQNDQVHEVLGKVAQDRGYKRVYVMVPNYQAGKDSSPDSSSTTREKSSRSPTCRSAPWISRLNFKIASLKPDAVFTFMPGGMGGTLVKQYRQAGLADKIPGFFSAFTSMNRPCPRSRMPRSGCSAARTGPPNLDNPPNKKFVAGYRAAYNTCPHLCLQGLR
jgi:branched-chain amino acid transport system substrate-binding protein